jgi:hypothetical protein
MREYHEQVTIVTGAEKPSSECAHTTEAPRRLAR